jgi:hypothetical protein
MEHAILADLAASGPIDMSPSCECGCDTRIGETGYLIHKGAIYRPEHLELVDGHCLFCGAETDGLFCDPDHFRAWDRQEMPEDHRALLEALEFNLEMKGA